MTLFFYHEKTLAFRACFLQALSITLLILVSLNRYTHIAIMLSGNIVALVPYTIICKTFLTITNERRSICLTRFGNLKNHAATIVSPQYKIKNSLKKM